MSSFYIQDICPVPPVAADNPELAIHSAKDGWLLLAYCVGRRIEGEANSELFFRHLSH